MLRSDSKASLAPSMTTPHPWSPPMTSTAIRIKQESAGKRQPSPHFQTGRLSQRLHRNHLSSLVEATGRADAVWHIRSRTLRAGAELGQGQHAVISPALTLTTSGRFSLGYAHRISISELQFVQRGPSRQTTVGLTGTARFLFSTRRRIQPATLRFTQRMLRKREQNIFAYMWRQVHEIIVRRHLLLSFKGQQAYPVGQPKAFLEGL